MNPYISNLPKELVDTDYLNRIHKNITAFSEDLLRFFTFECRLSDPEKDADFLFCIVKEQANFFSIPQEWKGNSLWQSILSFLEEWKNGNWNQVGNIWFELDKKELLADCPIPSLFFAPTLGLSKKEATELVIRFRQKFSLFAPSLNTDLMQHLYANLPTYSSIPQIGYMFSRESAYLRFYIHKISSNDAKNLLDKMSWAGNSEKLWELLLIVYSAGCYVDIDIDVGTSLGNIIGLECYFPNGDAYRLLDMLLSQNLCIVSKYQDLAKLDKKYYSIHHIKLVVDEKSILATKVYLLANR